MITSSLQIQIHQPLKDVYNFLMDIDNYPLWQSGLIKVSASNGLQQGSSITLTSFGMGKKFDLTATVISNDGHASFTVQSTRGPITFDSQYDLTVDNGVTTVAMTNKIETNFVFKIAEPVLQSVGDTKYQTDLMALKTILESRAAQAPATSTG